MQQCPQTQRSSLQQRTAAPSRCALTRGSQQKGQDGTLALATDPAMTLK